MNKRFSAMIMAGLMLSACQYNKSVKMDFLTGLTVKGDGLSSRDVTITTSSGIPGDENKYIYGETITLNFNNVEGLDNSAGATFPAMELVVLDKAGDTVMYNPDLYAEDTEGFTHSPLVLESIVTMASPMASGEEYKLLVNITDKKGKGSLAASYDFSVVPNSSIKLRSEGLSFTEAYYYSKNSEDVILDGKINLDEEIYLLIEGVRGFKEEDGFVYPGISIKATGNDGVLIVGEADVIGDQKATPEEVAELIQASLVFSGGTVSNPVKCEYMIWDKRSDKKLFIESEITVE